MQVPRRIHLCPQHRFHALGRQRGDHRVIQRPSGVNHGGQRVLHRNIGNQLGQRRPVGGVTGDHLDLGAKGAQLLGQLCGPRSVRTTPTDQDQLTHPVVSHHMAGQRRAGHPGATGDEYRACRPRVGHGQHDLADMAGLAQVAQGRRRAPHVKCRHRKRPQHILAEQRGELGEDLRDVIRPRLEEVEGPVSHTGVLLGDHRGLADVGLAHLQEDTAGGNQP